jgi:hypothetical protein
LRYIHGEGKAENDHYDKAGQSKKFNQPKLLAFCPYIWGLGCHIRFCTRLFLEAISKKSFRPDLCRPAERFFQLDGLEEASTGGRGSSGVGIIASNKKANNKGTIESPL